ncbi:MAG: hypothetical protein INR68_18280 [Methylobacterium mesophilicum]|nr:hypothetical protein [Methylobacterium mesophilicum]
MHVPENDAAVTPERFTEETMLLFSSNVPLEEMRLRIEQLFRRAMSVGALAEQARPRNEEA